MRAFHNDPKIKEDLLAQLRAHAAADEIVKGVYWQKGKGCAVGCTVHSADHALYESKYGIPRVLARLEDGIFEGLINLSAKTFPVEFIEAIPVGADLSLVWPKFAHWLLMDSEHGVYKYAGNKQVVSDVAHRHELWVGGQNPETSEWRSADADAADAADAAADAYADAAADAADAAAAYADDAAAYADADAADAAYATARSAQKIKLLQLLSEA